MRGSIEEEENVQFLAKRFAKTTFVADESNEGLNGLVAICG
jgi:hypothetical protein